MSDEFESLNSRMPDFASVLAARAQAKKAGDQPAQGKIDPYQMMLKKKRQENGEEPVDAPVNKWPEADMKKLQDYCASMGIMGFNCGHMHPLAALAMLKQQFGENFSGVPLEERLPIGFEKLGTHSSTYGPNRTYSSVMKRQVING